MSKKKKKDDHSEEKSARSKSKKEASKSVKPAKSSISSDAASDFEKRTVSANKSKPIEIKAEDIAMRAYLIYERRTKLGWPGDEASDWIEAEKQLLEECTRKKKKKAS